MGNLIDPAELAALADMLRQERELLAIYKKHKPICTFGAQMRVDALEHAIELMGREVRHG